MTHTALDTPARVSRLRGGAIMAPAPGAAFRISGRGALDCLQGLWTNDLEEPGDSSLTYGALLTPKGMVITDGWTLRSGDAIEVYLPPLARKTAAGIFQRTLPPRLASVSDITEEIRVLQLLGDAVGDLWPVVPLGRLPELGKVAPGDTTGGPYRIATPITGPFRAILFGSADAVAGVEVVLRTAGMVSGDEDDREAARIMAGWPGLGSEIDERTLPQEVRFDEHHGISYTKGCYTGQETVARLHFRGHANRTLRGVRSAAPLTEGTQILAGAKPVGHICSVLSLPGRTIALAMLRREISPGNRLNAGASPVVVTELPFQPGDIEG